MKNKVIVTLLALGALVASAAFDALPGHGQGTDKTAARAAVAQQMQAPAESTVRPTAAIRERRAGSAELNAAFNAAAAQNLSLRNDLTWAFGGKQQRGWYLYVPLISRTLDTEGDAATPEFASALARWQKTAGLSSNGVLDDQTLYKMVSTWQAARLNSSASPSPDQLVTAPTSDFWDTSRPAELRQVRSDAYAAYKRMVAAAVADPSLHLDATKDGELAASERFLKIVSAFRSREYQEQLRRQSPNAGRAGLAVNSPHFTGCALDLYVGGDPVDTKDANRLLQVQTPVYQWLVRNASKFGFRPYYYEPWHWEYVGGLNADRAAATDSKN